MPPERRLRPVLVLAVVSVLAASCGVRSGDVLRAKPTGSGGSGFDGSALDGPAAELPPASITSFFLSPTGADTNPGTEAKPWKTFAHALPLLRPGHTLVLLDGTYGAATTGY